VIPSRYSGFRVRSPGHFAERHGLVVIIALGESLAAVGAGVAGVPVTAAILGAALLGFAVTVCLWLLYFWAAAPAAERRLVQLQGKERAWLARDAGTLLHLPLIAGIIYMPWASRKYFGMCRDRIPGTRWAGRRRPPLTSPEAVRSRAGGSAVVSGRDSGTGSWDAGTVDRPGRPRSRCASPHDRP
jgi:hypothetical protein